jgi:beta-xylosidase
MGKTLDKTPGVEYARIPLSGAQVTLKVHTDFDQMLDEAVFYYRDGPAWQQIGTRQKLYFGLDHFVGCRFGLFVYATQQTGGEASFSHFVYEPPQR